MKDRESWTKWAQERLARHAEAKEVSAIGSKQARTGKSAAAIYAASTDVRSPTFPRHEWIMDKPKPIVAGTLLHPLIALCRLHGLPEPRPEYAWHPTRRYRADYALVAERILIEIDGGLWIQGGHSRGAARLHDMEKDREATMLGWRTLRYPPAAESQIVTDLKRMLGR